MRLASVVLSVAGVLVTLRGVTLDPLQWSWPAIWGLVMLGAALMLAGYTLAGRAAARAERRRRAHERPGYIDHRR